MKFTTLAVAAAMTLVLAGCGGGDGNNDTGNNGGSNSGDTGGNNGGSGGDTPPPPVVTGAGFYSGLDVSGTHLVKTMAFDDGSYYVIYMDPHGTPDKPGIGAFAVGTGTYNNGSFTSTDARFFQGEDVFPATLSASYTAKKNITGTFTVASPPTSVGFSGDYDASYEETPSLPALAGAFTGSLSSTAGSADVTVNVSTTGAITGSGGGCNFSGTATPKTSGNAYDVKLTLGAAPCIYPNQTLSGAAIYSDNVLAAIATASGNVDVIFFGTKATPK